MKKNIVLSLVVLVLLFSGSYLAYKYRYFLGLSNLPARHAVIHINEVQWNGWSEEKEKIISNQQVYGIGDDLIFDFGTAKISYKIIEITNTSISLKPNSSGKNEWWSGIDENKVEVLNLLKPWKFDPIQSSDAGVYYNITLQGSKK